MAVDPEALDVEGLDAGGLDAELVAAIVAVRAASALCRGAQGRPLAGHTLTKGDQSPVTIADFAAQAGVCAELTGSLGGIEMIGEEGARLCWPLSRRRRCRSGCQV